MTQKPTPPAPSSPGRRSLYAAIQAAKESRERVRQFLIKRQLDKQAKQQYGKCC
jgi:hypothetical protein